MTQSEAIQILIYGAAENCRGAGRGIHTLASPEEKQRVREAVIKVWRLAFKFPVNDSELRSYGL